MTGQPRVSIVVPIYNEEVVLAAATAALLRQMDASGLEYEVILAENGSADATPQIADRLAAEHPRARAIHLPEPDYGRAMRAGFLEGQGEVLANFSIDLVDLGFLQRALGEMGRADVVLGSKYVAQGHDERPLARRLGGQALSALVRLLFRLPVADTHGLLVLRRERVRELVERCRFGNEIFDTELVVRAHRAGLRLVELPLRVEEIRPSRVGSFRRARRMVQQFLRLRVALWREGLR